MGMVKRKWMVQKKEKMGFEKWLWKVFQEMLLLAEEMIKNGEWRRPSVFEISKLVFTTKAEKFQKFSKIHKNKF